MDAETKLKLVQADCLALEREGVMASDILDAWHGYILRHSQTEAGRGRHAWHRAMTMSVFRSIDSLCAIRSLCLAGRPLAAAGIFRSAYEAWLNLLTVGFHNGRIADKYLSPCPRFFGDKARARHSSPTKEQIARRFIAFMHHVELEESEYLLETNSDWRRLGNEIGVTTTPFTEVSKKKLEKGSRARKVYGFGRQSGWSPFRSVNMQRLYLWDPSTNKPPVFPMVLVDMGSTLWEGAFRRAYYSGSHLLHASGAAYTSIGRPSHHKSAAIENTPYPDPALLGMSSAIVQLSTAAFAGAMGNFAIWNETVGKVRLR